MTSASFKLRATAVPKSNEFGPTVARLERGAWFQTSNLSQLKSKPEQIKQTFHLALSHIQETKSSYYRAVRKGLLCYAVDLPNRFKRRATAVLESNLILVSVRDGNSATFETGLTLKERFPNSKGKLITA